MMNHIASFDLEKRVSGGNYVRTPKHHCGCSWLVSAYLTSDDRCIWDRFYLIKFIFILWTLKCP
jgi:hypothetical protein